jgi:hypothetical protein
MKRFAAVAGGRIATSLVALVVAFGGAAGQQSPGHHIVPLNPHPPDEAAILSALAGVLG